MWASGVTANNIDHVSGTELSTDLSFANAITSPYTAFSIPKWSVCQINITITVQRILTGWNTHLKPRCYLTESINAKPYVPFSNNFTSVLGNSLCEAKTILEEITVGTMKHFWQREVTSSPADVTWKYWVHFWPSYSKRELNKTESKSRRIGSGTS